MNRPGEDDYNFYENPDPSNAGGNDNDPFGQDPNFGSGSQNGASNGGYNPDYAYTVLTRPKTRVWSILAIVFGALSVLCCCCFDFAGVVFGIASIVFAIISRKTLGYFDTTSIIAIIIAIFGIILSVALFVVGFMMVNSPEYKELIESLEQMYGIDIDGDGLVNGMPVEDVPPKPNNPNEF